MARKQLPYSSKAVSANPQNVINDIFFGIDLHQNSRPNIKTTSKATNLIGDNIKGVDTGNNPIGRKGVPTIDGTNDKQVDKQRSKPSGWTVGFGVNSGDGFSTKTRDMGADHAQVSRGELSLFVPSAVSNKDYDSLSN